MSQALVEVGRNALLCLAIAAATLQVGCNKSPTTVAATPAGNQDPLVAKADAGDSAAMVALGQDFAHGTNGRKKDDVIAFQWYLRAANAGSPKAMAEVARRYRDGNGVREDFDASMPWADKGASLNDPDAIYLSAIRNPFDLFIGWESIINSESEEAKILADSAAELSKLNRAAEAGSIDAKVRLGGMLRLGVWYVFGKTRKVATPPDVNRSIKLIVEASDGGSAIATLYAAQWYQVGGDGLKADPAAALIYWDRLDAVRDADEEFAIGKRIKPAQRKYFVAEQWRDRQLTYEQAGFESRAWLEKAALQGHAQAAFELGQMLSLGDSGYTDEAKSFKYLLQAAEGGSIDGQRAVSKAYHDGSGTAKDYERAYSWALRAATHPTATAIEMAKAQRIVALFLSQGIGIEKDPVLAYAWANVSAATGNKGAKELLATLDGILDASQVREAQQISSAWTLGANMQRLGVVAVGAANAGASAPNVTVGGSKLVGSGSGFFISSTGVFVTNFHVVGKCTTVKVPAVGKTATVLSVDASNDLAVLRVVGETGSASARLSDPSKLRQGQEISAFGFPLDGYLPSAGNITTGLVSALSGPANNSSLIQISAPVQQGNSGGPVLNAKGEVVGVVVGKADAIRIAKVTGDILQNVNFAVSIGTLQGFLDANQVEYQRPSFLSWSKSPEVLADEARSFTVKVECWQ